MQSERKSTQLCASAPLREMNLTCSLQPTMLKSSFTKTKIEAGCDEVGRGCLAGPVVAAAVILPKRYKHKLLTDSKQLKRADREQLQEEIKRDALAWAIAEVSHEEIDEINILKASFKAMHLALDKLIVEPELLLIDGNRFTPYREIQHECRAASLHAE